MTFRIPFYIKALTAGLLFCLVTGLETTTLAQSVNKEDSSSSGTIVDFYNRHKITSDEPGIHEFSFWGGYSFHSTNGVWGQTTGAELGVMGFRYNRKLLRFSNNYLLKYVMEMNLHVQYHLSGTTQNVSASSLSGFGMTPIGFQLNFRDNHVLQPFFKSSAGFMHLTDPFPDKRGTKFNFTLEVGGGVEIKFTEHSSFTLGYKYHHMSNGQFGQVNPGVDSNVFYGGITIF